MDEKRNCPKCGNSDCDINDSFCWNCGAELGNCCENEECIAAEQTGADHGILDLPDNYVYCPYCGSLTRYGKAGYVVEVNFLS